jgi:hypothetical protein
MAGSGKEWTAGWYPDPYGRHDSRYWDGSAWTEHVQSNGAPGIDSLGDRKNRVAWVISSVVVGIALLVLVGVALASWTNGGADGDPPGEDREQEVNEPTSPDVTPSTTAAPRTTAPIYCPPGLEPNPATGGCRLP